MESFVSFSTLFNLVLTVIWFISGIRDLQGKDPFLDLPFNQYHRDPEYRAFWQKKNGVFYMLNSIAFLILASHLLHRCSTVSSSASHCGRPSLSCRLRKLEP
mgnify:CR=1 FL=1